MISIEKKIRELLREKNISVRSFCQTIGMTTTNLYKIYKKNSLDTKYLDRIAEEYNVNRNFFFVEGSDALYDVKNVSSNEAELVKKVSDDNEKLKIEVESLKKEVELLRELVESKNEIISGLKGRK